MPASKPGKLTLVKIKQKIIEKTEEDLFVLHVASIIVKSDGGNRKSRGTEVARRKFDNAVRIANRRQQADRPEEPNDMNFEL